MDQELSQGHSPIALPGFSYLPRFITEGEGRTLISYFGALRPLWEERHAGGHAARQGATGRRLTRPVYWLGAWQFACLGYYAPPLHVEDRCVRAEPFPSVMQDILGRLLPTLAEHHAPGESVAAPNTCLVNYYGSELKPDAKGRLQPVDGARLRLHRDSEPGPVVMFSIGQPALFEFVDPSKPDVPELSVWLKHRSVVILSGARFKDFLYHRVVRVRHGQEPALSCAMENFALRRVSVSFRFVPPEHIRELHALALAAQAQVRGYVEQLAEHSEHFRAQLRGCSQAPPAREGP